MTRLTTLFSEKPFSTIISLPKNEMDFVRAAVEADVDALKFHINVDHFASGNQFGEIEEYKGFIEEVRGIFNGPLGIVLGDHINKVSTTDYERLNELTVNYFSVYSENIDMQALMQPHIEKTVAIKYDFPLLNLKHLNTFGISAVELSIVQQKNYGEILNFDDMLHYQDIRDKTTLPLIIPSQKKLTAEDIKWMERIGINAVMLGAVCIGQNPNDMYDNIVHLTKNK